MDDSDKRFAYRCLPLAIANQSGWFITNPSSFVARWNGGPKPNDVKLVFDTIPPDNRINSHFGLGTITFNVPFLFRTPSGMNLWVKGPTNWPKDGAWPLEGVIETDWTCATFTMNWKLTRPGLAVRFERGEPICMVVPFPRNLLSQLSPVAIPIEHNPQVQEGFKAWSRSRDDFHRAVAEREAAAVKRGWQGDYSLGRDPGTEAFEQHQTKVKVRPFERKE